MLASDLVLYLDAGKTIGAAAISAGAVLWAVHLTNEKTAKREREKRDEERSRDRVSMLVILAAHLDDFAFACNDIAGDLGFTDSKGHRQPFHSVPQFHPLKVDGIDWRTLPPDLLDRVVGLPLLQKRYDLAIQQAGEDDFDDDQGATFFARREGYAGLGLEAARQAVWMREQAGLPPSELPKGNRMEMTTIGSLKRYLADFSRKRAEIEAAHSHLSSTPATAYEQACRRKSSDLNERKT